MQDYVNPVNRLAGSVEAGSLTLELLDRAIDDMVHVEGDEISEAARWRVSQARGSE